MVQWEPSEADPGFDLWRGLVNGILIAIPLWVVLGFAASVAFRLDLAKETVSTALMIAAVCEAMLARRHIRTLSAEILQRADMRRVIVRDDHAELRVAPSLRDLGELVDPPRKSSKFPTRVFNSIEDLLRHVESNARSLQARHAITRRSLLKQSLTLSAIVGSYLQYYFVDVNLQIASLHSIVFFVPVTSVS